MFFWWICGGESGLPILFLCHLRTALRLVHFKEENYLSISSHVWNCLISFLVNKNQVSFPWPECRCGVYLLPGELFLGITPDLLVTVKYRICPHGYQHPHSTKKRTWAKRGKMPCPRSQGKSEPGLQTQPSLSWQKEWVGWEVCVAHTFWRKARIIG